MKLEIATYTTFSIKKSKLRTDGTFSIKVKDVTLNVRPNDYVVNSIIIPKIYENIKEPIRELKTYLKHFNIELVYDDGNLNCAYEYSLNSGRIYGDTINWLDFIGYADLEKKGFSPPEVEKFKKEYPSGLYISGDSLEDSVELEKMKEKTGIDPSQIAKSFELNAYVKDKDTLTVYRNGEICNSNAFSPAQIKYERDGTVSYKRYSVFDREDTVVHYCKGKPTFWTTEDGDLSWFRDTQLCNYNKPIFDPKIDSISKEYLVSIGMDSKSIERFCNYCPSEYKIGSAWELHSLMRTLSKSGVDVVKLMMKGKLSGAVSEYKNGKLYAEYIFMDGEIHSPYDYIPKLVVYHDNGMVRLVCYNGGLSYTYERDGTLKESTDKKRFLVHPEIYNPSMGEKELTILRMCWKDGSSSHGFVYGQPGDVVEAPDWDPTPECGGGLYGLLNANGDHSLLKGSQFLAIKVYPEDLVVIDNKKVKFRKGTIVYRGDMSPELLKFFDVSKFNEKTIEFWKSHLGDLPELKFQF